jgi:predicted nuclease of predicted toxin-antitoxin system
VKFLVDMPLSPALAHWLAALGHDAASTLGLDRASDAEILARAARDMRTVVTADLDYPRLLALAVAAGPGLILFRRGDWSEADVIARTQQLLDNLSEGRCNAEHHCYRARSSTSTTLADILTAADDTPARYGAWSPK